MCAQQAAIPVKVPGAYVHKHECLETSLTTLSCRPGVTDDPTDPCLQDYVCLV